MTEIERIIEQGREDYLEWYKKWWNLPRPNQKERERLADIRKSEDEFIAKAIEQYVIKAIPKSKEYANGVSFDSGSKHDHEVYGHNNCIAKLKKGLND